MILVDANVLLYAYNPSAEHHDTARKWLERAFAEPEPIGMSWATLVAFIRLGTNPRAFPRPLSTTEATDTVSAWLAHPTVVVVDPGERHWPILKELLEETGARGAEVTDAHLAALAIEHGVVLYTTDRGFRRFPGLRFSDPLK